MGVVYKAEDTKLDRRVALKFLASHLVADPVIRKRFEREARAAASLDHPNICTIHEIDEVDGETFLAMALVEGQSLEARIEEGPLPLQEAVDIARQVAEGLQAAHEKRIVHRDIKPGNILVTPEGRAEILDFGLALLTEGSKLTKLDAIVGTAAYMSPEQAQGSKVDRRTDLWAVGCVLYEMVRGKQPFPGLYNQAVLYEICNEDPEPLTAVRADVPMELELLVGKCLAKDRENRYQSASELIVDLRTTAEKLKSGRSRLMTATRAAAALSPGTADAPGWRRRAPWALLACATALCAALGYGLWNQLALERPVRRFVLAPELAGGPSLGADPSLSWSGNAVLSPDGRHIAYQSDETPPRLWVWSLADPGPRPLPGTENGSRPFWSPNSEFLGFIDLDQRAVKRTTLTAPGSILVCSIRESLPAVRGSVVAAWSPDGRTIVFASGFSPVRFYSASAGGGPSEQLDVQAAQDLRTKAMSVSFLPTPPERPTLLFSAASPVGGGLSGIYLLDLSSGALTLLADTIAVDSMDYSRSGHLLLTDEGTLWSQPFSLERLELTGERFRVADGLTPAGVSADGTLLAIEDRGAMQTRFEPTTELVLRDRAGKRIEPIGPPLVGAYNPVVSPDGQSVLVSAKRAPADDRDIWLLQFGRNTMRRITSLPGVDDAPSWRPHSREIVFRHQSGGGAADLFMTSIDGVAAPTPITETPEREAEPAWSPDGETLVYMSRPINADSAAFDLYLAARTPDGEFESSPFLSSEFNEAHPQYSPDGRYLAFLNTNSGRPEIYVRAISDASKLWQISEEGGFAPRWSRDGRELFWMSENKLMRAAVDFSRPAAPVSGITVLFDVRSVTISATYYYDVTPDGRFVFVEPVGEQADATVREEGPRMHLIENWYEEFRDRE